MSRPSGQAELDNFDRINPRKEHRKRFWETHSKELYTCPDCQRPAEEIDLFEIHHLDGNPYNGDRDNLVALCFSCHRRRHRQVERDSRIEGWQDDWDELLLDDDTTERLQDSSLRQLDEIE